MTEHKAMRARSSQLTHATPASDYRRTVCGKDCSGWVVSDSVPDCKRCLFILALQASKA